MEIRPYTENKMGSTAPNSILMGVQLGHYVQKSIQNQRELEKRPDMPFFEISKCLNFSPSVTWHVCGVQGYEQNLSIGFLISFDIGSFSGILAQIFNK